MVGSAILRVLKARGYQNIIFASKKDLDLRDQLKVSTFLKNINLMRSLLQQQKLGAF